MASAPRRPTAPPARRAVLALLSLLLLAAQGLASTGDPDVFGYTWADRNDGCAAGLPDFGPGAMSFPGANAPVGPFAIPFDFAFYETAATQLFVDPKGYVTFSAQPTGTPQALPTAVAPDDLIATFWHDAPDADITVEVTPDWAHVRWQQSLAAAPAMPVTDVHLFLWPGGAWTYTWPEDGGLLSATIGYEDAAGVRGRTHYRSFLMREDSFPRPTGSARVCVWPARRLDCSAPIVMTCSESRTLTLPMAGTFADSYSCAPSPLAGNERIVSVELTEFGSFSLTVDQPGWELIELDSPPDCHEWRCLRSETGVLQDPIRSPGIYWFAIDAPSAPPGASFRLDADCRRFGEDLTCGQTVTDDTATGTRFFNDRGCATAALDGPELAYRFVLADVTDVSLELDTSAADAWLVLHDAAGFDADGGSCLIARRGSLGVSGLAAGEYVVVVDSGDLAGFPFSLTLSCSLPMLDCSGATELSCGEEVVGDTATAMDRVLAWPCSHGGFAGGEDVYWLRNPIDQAVRLELLDATPGQRIVLLDACDPAACRQVGLNPTCRSLAPGDYFVLVDGPAGSEGPYRLRWTCSAARVGVDLRVVSVDATGLTGDCNDLAVAGQANVVIANLGDMPATAPFELQLVEDEDLDGQVGPADELFGSVLVATDLGPGESRALDVPASGVLSFRDKPLLAFVDATAAMTEADEANNTLSSSSGCTYRAPAGSIDPMIEWEWTGSTTLPDFDQVRVAPVVGDLDGDGSPEVVLSTARINLNESEGVLRVLSGADGSEVWTASAAGQRVHSKTQLAVADLDGDGTGEVLALSQADNARLLAFNSDGSFRWTSDPFVTLPNDFAWFGFGAPAIGDLNEDGVPEIAWGAEVIDATGRRFWTAEAGGTVGGVEMARVGLDAYAVIADVNLDGRAELIAGPTAYRYDDAGVGRILWTNPAVPDGSTAITDFDSDGLPEVVVVSARSVFVLEGATGELRWSAELTRGGGDCSPGGVGVAGVPTIADFDGDCALEIGVLAAEGFSVFGPEGELEWQIPLPGCEVALGAGATAFDFEADGTTEVVLLDGQQLLILDGRDGSLLARAPADLRSGTQLAIVADVDGDFAAEILVPLSTFESGLRLFGDANDDWANTRSVWNQHSYHVNNIGDDLRVPSPEPLSWVEHGTYRTQLDASSAALAPDLTVTILAIEGLVDPTCDRFARITARVGNAGPIAVGLPFEARFYEGDPAAGGVELGTLFLDDLAAGAFRDFETTVPLPWTGVLEIHVVVDDAGLGQGRIRECREDNNACFVELENAADGLVRPADVGNALRALGHGPSTDAETWVDLDWSLDEGAPRTDSHSHLLRGVDPRVLTPLVGLEPIAGTNLRDADARASAVPLVHFYRVLAADGCEQVSGD